MGDPRVEALERKVLANSLKQYAINGITGAIKQEYDERLARWETHLNSLTAYASTALDQHKNVINMAREDRRREAELAMLVLSLMAGPALSFVSGALQYKLFPKFFGTSKPTSSYVVAKRPTPPPPPAPCKVDVNKAKQVVELPAGSPKVPSPPPVASQRPPVPKPPPGPPRTQIQKFDERQRKKENFDANSNARGYKKQQDEIDKAKKVVELPKSPANTQKKPAPNAEPSGDKVYVVDPSAHDKVGAKVFGDMGGSMVAQMGTSLVAEKPSDKGLLDAISTVPDSASLEIFKANLRNVWVQGRERGKAALEKYSATINNDASWGDNLLDGKIPGVAMYRDPRATDRAAEEHYYKQIRGMLDKQREQWAREWYFYGNDPIHASQNHAVSALETEMWALWIRTESFRYVTKLSRSMNYGGKPEFDKVVGNSGLKIDRFATRLLQLGVIEGSQDLEFVRRQKGVSDQVGLQAMEINDIYGDVDTAEEVRSINTWAWNHQPKLLTGQIGATRRTIKALNEGDVKKP